MEHKQVHGPTRSYWALAVAGLVLLAACTSLPGTAPATSEGTPLAMTATAGPPAAGDASAAEELAGRATSTAATAMTGVPAITALPTILEPTTPPQATVAPALAFACTPGELTPAQTEGPYYIANPPETASLLQPGMSGTKITVSGYVLDVDCRPVPGARVDFWQADSQDRYDNRGYALRGYQVTDAQGRYSMETVVPGLYPGRTSHIHVKVTAPNGPTLTTQLYFPDEAANVSDGIYNQRMLLTIEKTGAGELGRYDFVINTK
jgi:protocatechuate 3,4-dioxygenase beta subunit